jgi:hypothetical protein
MGPVASNLTVIPSVRREATPGGADLAIGASWVSKRILPALAE